MSFFHVTKVKTFTQKLLYYLLFLLSNFITVLFVLSEKHKAINSLRQTIAHVRECNKNFK